MPHEHDVETDAATALTVEVSAVVLRDEAGRVLNVRKRGTDMFMLPGGKPEPGESPAETVLREIREELGLELDAARLVRLGTFEAPAANESGFTVLAHVFEHPFVTGAVPAAEIAEMAWLDPSEQRADIAPLNLLVIFPLLTAR